MARLVTVSATIDGVDDETFGANERGHAEFTRSTVLDNNQPQNVMEMQCRWGDECRVELRITGQQLDNSDVRITGEMLLFEGTSESTNDLDGRKDFSFIVPKGKTATNSQHVDNQDEGGDFADVRMTITNQIVE
ncbi:hypothetical protein V5E97_04080 [Singulisphaera sp. Ch08]|uniref:Uncharacterized protein n=1 Tax=Singulisphaera sp. Ch08 TaxID=3120278 RepID=A0AAU7CKN8_9BACT